MKVTRLHSVIFLCCLLFNTQFLSGASDRDIVRALDLEGASGIELVRQEWVKYKWKFVTDEWGDKEAVPDVDGAGNQKIEQGTSSKWIMQRGTWGKRGIYPGVTPVQGDSCVRSGIGSDAESCTLANDDQRIRLVFKVNGGGMLYYSCLTACDTSDGVIVYVDGVEVNRHFDGYGMEQFWGYDPDTGELEGSYEVEIFGGLAPEESAYGGTYNHEVVFEFYKDEPNYGLNFDDVFVSWDKPDRPNERDYWWDGVKDTEQYNADMGEYYSFKNSVWLDNFKWVPTPPRLVVGNENESGDVLVVDRGEIPIHHNALEFGYQVRYTLDGSEPTSDSPVYVHPDPMVQQEAKIVVDRTCTVIAAMFTTDKEPKPVLDPKTKEPVRAVRKVIVQASQPRIVSSTITADEAIVVLAPTDEHNEIRYTLDGSEPSESSLLYDNGIVIKHASTVKAVCVRQGVAPSSIIMKTIEQAEQPGTISIEDYWGNPSSSSYVYESGIYVMCVPSPNGDLTYSLDGGNHWDVVKKKSLFINYDTGVDSIQVSFRTVENGKLASEQRTTMLYMVNKTWNLAETKLTPGWNLISCPITLVENDVPNTLRLYRYDDYNCVYVISPKLNEGEAYWYFNHQGAGTLQEVLPLGKSPRGVYKASKTIEQLTAGWHALGIADNVTDLEQQAVVAWSYQNGGYVLVGKEGLKKGQGYFIYKK